ncbi:hypothetical protein [Actinokineospora sp. UTMC 2448]|uniref:hypothetical protein n=1 Tax=Actinokineospora sp. UTMC 2448 TaxID=2268449 RepID=UPI002164C7A2|nr:hypothetical protein [Actinokineospora sp. UTMC 2448]
MRARVRAGRRRRAAAAAICAVAAIAGMSYAVSSTRVASAPAGPVPVEGFAEYLGGARVIAQGSGELPGGVVRLRFTPGADELVLFTRCDVAPGSPSRSG